MQYKLLVAGVVSVVQVASPSNNRRISPIFYPIEQPGNKTENGEKNNPVFSKQGAYCSKQHHPNYDEDKNSPVVDGKDERKN